MFSWRTIDLIQGIIQASEQADYATNGLYHLPNQQSSFLSRARSIDCGCAGVNMPSNVMIVLQIEERVLFERIKPLLLELNYGCKHAKSNAEMLLRSVEDGFRANQT